MIDTSTWMWYTRDKTATVWAHAESGEVLIADCYNKNTTISSQRLNARLCSEAPHMYALLHDLTEHMTHEQYETFAEMIRRLHASQSPEN